MNNWEVLDLVLFYWDAWRMSNKDRFEYLRKDPFRGQLYWSVDFLSPFHQLLRKERDNMLLMLIFLLSIVCKSSLYCVNTNQWQIDLFVKSMISEILEKNINMEGLLHGLEFPFLSVRKFQRLLQNSFHFHTFVSLISFQRSIHIVLLPSIFRPR